MKFESTYGIGDLIKYKQQSRIGEGQIDSVTFEQPGFLADGELKTKYHLVQLDEWEIEAHEITHTGVWKKVSNKKAFRPYPGEFVRYKDPGDGRIYEDRIDEINLQALETMAGSDISIANITHVIEWKKLK